MTTNLLTFRHDELDASDMFCGAGGSASGLARAGLTIRWAANHWNRAIETHSANFPDTEHECADVSNLDMRRLPRTAVLWASPICTEASPAGGRRRNRRNRGQIALELEGHVPADAFVRTRATFGDVIRATEVHRYMAVLVENVVDVAWEWELFDWWVNGMELLGYNVQFVSVSSAHVGGDGNPHAPQWRDRLYLVFTRKGVPLPDVDPRPRAHCPVCNTDVDAIQSWKKPGRRIGKYRQQYTYVCPNAACKHATVEPYVVPAITAIDWADPGVRIGDRAELGMRKLAANTLAKIAVGNRMYPSDRYMFAVNHGPGDIRYYLPGDQPLPTRTVKIGDGIAAPYITELRGGGSTTRPVTHPLATVTGQGRHHGLTIPHAWFLKNYGGNARPQDMCKPVTEPLGTVTGIDHHCLVIPYRKGSRAYPATDRPLDTVTTVEARGVAHATDDDVANTYFRMLKPREHLAAQRFPRDYIVKGNLGEQTMQAGAAVSSNVAQWLGTAVTEALTGEQVAA